MPLITDRGFTTDTWLRLESDAPAQSGASTIWPQARLEEALAFSSDKIGVQVANTVKVAELAPHFARLAVISVHFPSFSDGRGFSIARSLRLAGFKGEIRAFGPLIADQFAHARACGFDAVEMSDAMAQRQPEAHWKAAIASLSLSYQRSYRHGENILDQRRRFRAAQAEKKTGTA